MRTANKVQKNIEEIRTAMAILRNQRKVLRKEYIGPHIESVGKRNEYFEEIDDTLYAAIKMLGNLHALEMNSIDE